VLTPRHHPAAQHGTPTVRTLRPNVVGNVPEPQAHRTALFEHLRITVMALALFAYFFNVLQAQTLVDDAFRRLNLALHARTGQATELFSALIPILIVAVLVFVICLTLSGAFRALRNLGSSARLSNHEFTSIHEFVALAAHERISIPVARQAYHLLEPHYDGLPGIRLTDRLDKLLHLSQTERANLLATLLRDSNRIAPPYPDQNDVLTVLELLQTAESCPPHRLSRIA